MASVASVDGTTIDYDITGSGPVIVSVAGVFNLWDTFTPLAAELSSDHTVLTYDRRGRGKSSDTAPCSIEREVEDPGDYRGGRRYGISVRILLRRHFGP
jgi:pimeloyl-ACP methyl ester carboxylesterase